MIVMRDGKVVGDSPVTNRSNAEKELSRLQQERKSRPNWPIDHALPRRHQIAFRALRRNRQMRTVLP